MTRRGRPPLDAADPSVKLSLTLPSRRYDALWRTAADERQTMSAVLRRALDRELRILKIDSRDADG